LSRFFPNALSRSIAASAPKSRLLAFSSPHACLGDLGEHRVVCVVLDGFPARLQEQFFHQVRRPACLDEEGTAVLGDDLDPYDR